MPRRKPTLKGKKLALTPHGPELVGRKTLADAQEMERGLRRFHPPETVEEKIEYLLDEALPRFERLALEMQGVREAFINAFLAGRRGGKA